MTWFVFQKTPLHHAILNDDVFQMNKLLDDGADPNAQVKEDNDPYSDIDNDDDSDDSKVYNTNAVADADTIYLVI